MSQAERSKRWQENHKELIRERSVGYRRKAYILDPEKAKNKTKAYSARLKSTFIEMYGGACSCCGETEQEFLSLDHVQGQVGIKRKESSISAWNKAIKEYRPDLYQVLCMNCNFAKGKFGICPHQKRKQGTSEVSMVAYAQARTTTG